MSNNQKYRADIDGLRAIAVSTVILYHLGFDLFSGGYVGVDVFFVISGYLITGIIKGELDAGHFSLLQFYERRFRRILPALLSVVVASAACGMIILSPAALQNLGQSIVGASFFSSNVVFFLQSGYFDGPAELKPLLHTWSLAVEEQYYLFFPILMVALYKFKVKRYVFYIAAIGAASFAASELLLNINASAAFYLLPSRAWELFTGASISLSQGTIKQILDRRNWVGHIAATIGIGLIIVPALFYTHDTRFPGSYAIAPVLGAALIIAAGLGGRPAASRWLGSPPLVFVGLISYSLYLWHWPVIVFIKYYWITDPPSYVAFASVPFIVFISYLSWRFIESPFRKSGNPPRSGRVIFASASAIVICVILGTAMTKTHGFPSRYKEIFSETFISGDSEWTRWRRCEEQAGEGLEEHPYCTIGATTGNASFIFWGDSHATALAAGMNKAADMRGRKGFIATRSACAPLLRIDRDGRTDCSDFNEKVLQFILRSPELKTVILAARWSFVSTGLRYRNESGSPMQLYDIEQGTPRSNNLDLFRNGLQRTVSLLRESGRHVVIVGPVPEIGYDVPESIFIAKITRRDAQAIVAPSRAEYESRSGPAKIELARLNDIGDIHLIILSEIFCDKKHCNIEHDGTILYRDDDHLSTAGSFLTSNALASAFD